MVYLVYRRRDGKTTEVDFNPDKETLPEALKRCGLPANIMIDPDHPTCEKCGSGHLFHNGDCAECAGLWKSDLS